MPIRVITPPATEPVTLPEAKAHLRLESNLDDVQVDTLVRTARQYVEQVCWRGLVSQTIEYVTDAFPSDDGGIELPFGNLVSVTSVTYVDANGAEQTMPSSDYSVDTVRVPGRVMLAYGKTWPTAREQWDAVKVRYAVGWAASSVPLPLKHAILLIVSHLYEHRTPEVIGASISQVQFAIDALIWPYRLTEF